MRGFPESLFLWKGFSGVGFCLWLSFSASAPAQIEVGDILEGFIKADFRPVFLQDTFLPVDPLRSHLSLGEIPILPGSEHPGLLFSQQMRVELQSRVKRRPYSVWWHNLKSRAQTALTMDLGSRNLKESQRALYAEASAFVYFIEGDGDYLQKAKEALLSISAPPGVVGLEGGEPGEGWGDFVAASVTMLPYLVAYDIVAPELTQPQDRLIRHRLAAEAIQLYHYLPVATPNNHKTVMAAAVGAAALCLSSHRDYQIAPEKWFRRAIENLEVGLSEISADGSYKEGPYYATFIAQQTFGFFLFVKNCAGVNYFEDIRIRKFTNYLLDIRDLGGETAVFDDSYHSRYNFLPLASGNLRETQKVNWAVINDPFIGQRGYNLVASIANFDDGVAPGMPPEVEVCFYPDGGQAIFRSHRGSGGIYALLLGEPRQQFSTGHEHYDPGNLVLNVYGQDFLVASGYGPEGTCSSNRDYYLLPESENVVLVNGRGPNRNPLSLDDAGSRLVDLFHTEKIAAASAISSYRGAELRRTLLLPDFSFVVLYDKGQSCEPSDFTLLFHTPTSCQSVGTRSLTLETRTGKRLRMVYLGNPQSSMVTFGSGVFSSRAQQEAISSLIEVKHFGQRRLNSPILFLPEGILYREIPLVENPKATAFLIQPSVGEGNRFVAITCDSGSCEYEGIITNARFCLFKKSSRGLGLFYAFDCSDFSYRGQMQFQSSETVDIFLQNQLQGWSGLVSAGTESVAVEIYIGFDPGRIVFADRVTPYRYHNGSVSFKVAGSGYLTVGLVQPVSVPYKYRESPSVTRRLGYHPDPMWHYHHLTPEAQAQADEEIAQEVLAAFDHTVGRWMETEGFEHPQAHRWGNAMAGFLGQFGGANIGVAQELSGNWDLGGGQVQLREEGLIKEQGLRFRRLVMSYGLGEISSLSFRRTSVLKGHSSTYLGLDSPGRYRGFVEREVFRDKKDYSFGVSWWGCLSLCLETNLNRPGPGRSHHLLLQKGGIRNRISFGKSIHGEGFESFYHSYTSRHFSPWLWWSSSRLNCGFVARPIPGTSMEARFADTGENSSRLNWRRSQWGGEFQLFRSAQVTNGLVRTDLTRDRWQFQLASDWYSQGSFLRAEMLSAEWLGDGCLSGGMSLGHIETERDWESQLHLSKTLTKKLSSSGRVGYLLRQAEISLCGVGLYYYGRNHLGCDIVARRFPDEYNYYLSWYVNLYAWGSFALSLLSELQYDQDWDLVSARELLGAVGSGVSPGLYHRYDRFFGHQVQGNICFRF